MLRVLSKKLFWYVDTSPYQLCELFDSLITMFEPVVLAWFISWISSYAKVPSGLRKRVLAAPFVAPYQLELLRLCPLYVPRPWPL